MEQIRISGKNLGELSLANFCERCFWIKLHCKKLPFQIPFPGIFSSIDSYNKKITNSHFERYKQNPSWFSGFGDIGEPIKLPHYSKFCIVDPVTNILLTGDPDAIFHKTDGAYFIIDYKTAKFTGTQDNLLPIYEVQLNSYAYIAEKTGFSPVSGLGLIYYEPMTEVSESTVKSLICDTGFAMNFSGKLLSIKLNISMIPKLLAKVREIYEFPKASEGNTNCKNCGAINQLVGVAKGL